MSDALERCLDHETEGCHEQGEANSATVYLVLRDKFGEFKLCSGCAQRRREEWRTDKRIEADKKAAAADKEARAVARKRKR